MSDSSNQPDTGPETRSFLTGRGKLVVAGVLIISALAYFAYVAFQGSTTYYVTVDELLTQGQAIHDQPMRVNGKMLPGSFNRSEGSTISTFVLTHEEGPGQLPTTYTGLVPDLFFNEHTQIVAEGRYRADGIFYAENIIVKCPSKYASVEEST